MGSAGYEPFDSDDARWLLYDIEVIVDKKLAKFKLDRQGYNWTDLIGAAHTLTQIRKAFGEDFDGIENAVIRVHECLVQISEDDDWMDEWKDPAAIKRSIRKTRKQFENAFEEYLYDLV